MERIRNQLKALSRQYNFCQKNRQRVANNLFWLLSQSFPWTSKILEGIDDINLSQNCIDFIENFWHVEIIRKMNFTEFTNLYKKLCKYYDLDYDEERAKDVYEKLCFDQSKLPYDEDTKVLIETMLGQFKNLTKNAENLEKRLIEISKKLPEYPIVSQMPGVTPVTGAVIMAEIGDIQRFDKRTAITAFAGIDPNTLRHSKENANYRNAKQDLKKALHDVIENILDEEYVEDPVYQFMQKKRQEGKSEPVCKTAGTNKFLRIYYGKIKSGLS